ncbi:MAG TPA: hypothetical protein VMZ53_01530 [Kofleriaceae bacterium]|nr:hypothetical protein [Kofleriaceae bacterium]
MKRWLVFVAVLACACPAKKGTGPTTGSQGSGSDVAVVTPPTNAKTCDEVKARVEGMYRAEAQAKEPKRVDEATADNTAMAMKDCATDPAKYVPCLAKAPTVAELEKSCLIPIDDEGTEGERK